MPNNQLNLIGQYMLSHKVKWHVAVNILTERGYAVRREPCGLSFWKNGKHVHFVW